IVSLVLWLGMDGDEDPDRGTGEVPSTTTQAEEVASAAPPPPPEPARIENVTSFDPGDRETGLENEADVPHVSDGDPATAWTTACYSNKYMGAKLGIGLVVQLDRPATGEITAVVDSAP